MPLKVLVPTLGSHGDVQPYVALGMGLRDAGHEVTLCAPLFFESFVLGHGLRYAPMDNGFVDLINSLQGRAALEGMGSFWGAMKVLATLLPQVGPLQERVQHDAWAAAQSVRPDLIVFHPKLGGAGTTHAGLRAGRPTVVCPFFGDQPFWARRVQALGVGPAAVPQRKLTAARLSAAIIIATTDAGMAARAAALGEKLRAERGVAKAVHFLEEVAHAAKTGESKP